MWERLDFRVARAESRSWGKSSGFDLDLSLAEVRAPNLQLHQGDIVAGPVEGGAFDLVPRGLCFITSAM